VDRAPVNPLKALLRAIVGRAARPYITGPRVTDAIACAAALQRGGSGSTLAYWNDTGEDPRQVCAAYLEAVDSLAAAGLPGYVSIKAPALGLSQELTDAVAARCGERGIGLHFDSLAAEHQPAVFAHIEQLSVTGVALGCTLPAKFGRSPADADRAIGLGLHIRIVKGQWDDPGQPVEPRRGFLTLVERLAGRATHVAVATHDPDLAERSLRMLLAAETPTELELLFGLPSGPVLDVAERLAVPVRVYVPYGRAWLPYAASAARRDPRILWRLFSDAVRGRPRQAVHTP
jgi:proline dehydrogenase